jgi:hypothetical protein
MLTLLIVLAATAAPEAAKGGWTAEGVGTAIGGAILTVIGGYGAIKASRTESKTDDQTKLITETLMVVGAVKAGMDGVTGAVKEGTIRLSAVETEIRGVKESIQKHGERLGALETRTSGIGEKVH